MAALESFGSEDDMRDSAIYSDVEESITSPRNSLIGRSPVLSHTDFMLSSPKELHMRYTVIESGNCGPDQTPLGERPTNLLFSANSIIG